jgi:hypothetical protein
MSKNDPKENSFSRRKFFGVTAAPAAARAGWEVETGVAPALDAIDPDRACCRQPAQGEMELYSVDCDRAD